MSDNDVDVEFDKNSKKLSSTTDIQSKRNNEVKVAISPSIKSS